MLYEIQLDWESSSILELDGPEVDLEKMWGDFQELWKQGLVEPSHDLNDYGYDWDRWNNGDPYKTHLEEADRRQANNKMWNAHTVYQQALENNLAIISKPWFQTLESSEFVSGSLDRTAYREVFIAYLIVCKGFRKPSIVRFSPEL